MNKEVPLIVSKGEGLTEDEVVNAYLSINASFGKVFRREIKPGFIRQISINEKNDLYSGLWLDLTGRLTLFYGVKSYTDPRWQLSDELRKEDWKKSFSHELGHALLSQETATGCFRRIKVYSANKNVLASETFANYSMIIASNEGDIDQINTSMSTSIRPNSVLFAPHRINSYIGISEFECDPPILHFILMNYGFAELKEMLEKVPGQNYSLPQLFPALVRYLWYTAGRIDMDEAFFQRYNSWLIKRYGFSCSEVGHQAYDWYQEKK
ncbi:MAG: hypothetical protein V1808_00970 [Candidatus Daviesbacteria bacterium]